MAKQSNRDPLAEARHRIAAAKAEGSTMINLSSLHLTALPPEIGSLTALQTLNLVGSQLTALPPEIGLLKALQTLHLGSNQLTAVPPEIGSLTALQALNLIGNHLTALPREVGLLTALRRLYLHRNQFTALPPEIGSLTTLQTLSLNNNKLITLPPEIGTLTSLKELNLDDNQLTMLPPEIASLTGLERPFLHNNAALGIPAEVLGPCYGTEKPANPADLLAYYFRTMAGARKLREVKLILVGRGEVGKTTFAEALQGRRFQKNRPPTEGINIIRWEVKPKGAPRRSESGILAGRTSCTVRTSFFSRAARSISSWWMGATTGISAKPNTGSSWSAHSAAIRR